MSVERVIAIAQSQIGYLEKATNGNLDSMTGNSGYNNYTKYARDLAAAGYYNGNKNGFAWCDVFVDWCFYQAYGSKAAAEKVECQTGTLGAGCEYSRQYYINAGRYSTTPKVGDQIFFKDSSGTICHTGLVYALSDSTVYTIEGNTSSTSGVVANGGGVARKSYARTYGRIAGYGHPRYDASEATGASTAVTPKTEYFYPYRKYKNGSTPEAVYEDSDFAKQYGSLNAGESCYCMARHGSAYAVVYQVDGYPDRWKMGYVKYNGGVS